MKKDSFIVDLWEKIFAYLAKISLFYWIRYFYKIYKKEEDLSYAFVDAWVLGHLILAFISTVVVYFVFADFNVIFYAIVIYGMLRIFEIIVYQINVIFFDQYRSKKKGNDYFLHSVVRMIILLLHNYFEIMLWYAAIVMALLRIQGVSLESIASWGEYVRSNILCVATFDREAVEALLGEYARDMYFSDIVFLEVLSGIIMTIISLARFISIMPEIKTYND